MWNRRAFLNMTGVLGGAFEPYWPGFWVSIAVIAALLVSGALYFRSAEKTFADVI